MFLGVCEDEAEMEVPPLQSNQSINQRCRVRNDSDDVMPRTRTIPSMLYLQLLSFPPPIIPF